MFSNTLFICEYVEIIPVLSERNRINVSHLEVEMTISYSYMGYVYSSEGIIMLTVNLRLLGIV